MIAKKPTIQRLTAALWNPIVAKEVHSRMRGGRALTLLIGFLTVLATFAWVSYRNLNPETARITALTSAGTSVFITLAWTTLAMLTLFVPGLMGGAIAGERERQTLDLLLVTPMRPLRIIMGKLVASLLFIVYLLAASLPIFSIVFVLGGVPLDMLAEVFVVLLATVFMLGSLGIMCSALMRRSASATLCAFVLTALVYLVPIIYMSANRQYSYYGSLGYGYSQPDFMANLSPYNAMQDVTQPASQLPAYYNYVCSFSGLMPPGGCPAQQQPPFAPPWVQHVIDAGIVSAVALLISVMSLRGRRTRVLVRGAGQVPQQWSLPPPPPPPPPSAPVEAGQS